MNDDLKEVLTRNPKIAAELPSIKEAMDELVKLRDAGVARGPQPLLPPHGGRYNFDTMTKQHRRSRAKVIAGA